MSEKVLDYIASKQKAAGASANLLPYWTAFEELYTKKLWHQLTIKLLQFIQKEHPTDILEIYDNFIVDFESKIKPLSLVEIASFVISHVVGDQAKLDFVDKIKERVKADNLSSISCNILSGRVKLGINDLKGTREIIEKTDQMIDDEMGVTVVHARYYQLTSDYYQKIGDHAEYYRNALRYLGCCGTSGVDIAESDEQQATRALALSLAALLGENVYNFGELLLHPILKKLRPADAYMEQLLYAFNSGDIGKMEQLKPQWQVQADLVKHLDQLIEKIQLLCIIELAFKSHNGMLKLADIARATRVSEHEVELLVMKALSKSLVKGTIDQVAGEVHITWVQPRVLNKDQIRGMKGRLETWIKDVNDFSGKLEQRGQEIIA